MRISRTVLFRESERLDLGLWLKHVFRDRQPTPTVSGAIVCGVSILMLKFFIELAAPQVSTFRGFAVQAVMLQIAVIQTPALILTFSLTTSPLQTLRLRLPHFAAVPAAALLAVLLHPTIGALRTIVMGLYPIREDLLGQLEGLQAMFTEPPLWQALVVIAVAPAICEELAFRGFISRVTPELQEQHPILLTLLGPKGESGILYAWPVVLVTGLLSLGIIAWFSLLPVAKSEEELEREEIARIRDAGPNIES